MIFKREQSSGLYRLAVVFSFVMVCILVLGTIWRESHAFWTDVGGFPLWERDAIDLLYYPLWFFTGSAIGMLLWSAIWQFFDDFKVRRVWLLLGCNLFIFLCCSVVIVVL